MPMPLPSSVQSHFDPTSMLSFDLGTTGTNPLTARIVTSALVSIHNGSVDSTELLADPGVDIPEAASQIHGISTEYAREHGKPHDSVLKQTIQAIYTAWDRGQTLIVFNAAYDLTILRHLDPTFTCSGLVLDPLVIDRALEPRRRGPRKLGVLCERYGIQLDNAHNASADALAAARLAWKMTRTWPDLMKKNTDELMEFQAVSYFDHQISLRDYFASQGREMTNFSTAWPMRDGRITSDSAPTASDAVAAP